MLLAKGYPDIGWNPIEGERYLSFLRFAVFVNGMAAITIQSRSLPLSLSPSAKQVEKTSKGSAIFERPSVSSLRQGLPSGVFYNRAAECSYARALQVPCLFSYDFMFFTPGESVEENSSVVVKLLIRRPECFGPALRGEGGNGLLAAMKEAIKISETPALDLPGSVHGVSSDV